GFLHGRARKGAVDTLNLRGSEGLASLTAQAVGTVDVWRCRRGFKTVGGWDAWPARSTESSSVLGVRSGITAPGGSTVCKEPWFSRLQRPAHRLAPPSGCPDPGRQRRPAGGGQTPAPGRGRTGRGAVRPEKNRPFDVSRGPPCARDHRRLHQN